MLAEPINEKLDSNSKNAYRLQAGWDMRLGSGWEVGRAWQRQKAERRPERAAFVIDLRNYFQIDLKERLGSIDIYLLIHNLDAN